jgi:acylphosphatase
MGMQFVVSNKADDKGEQRSRRLKPLESVFLPALKRRGFQPSQNLYVRNLTTGEVEVLAGGHQDALDELESWLNCGPSGAMVSGAIAIRVPFRELTSFRKLPDAERPESFDPPIQR